MTPLDWIILAVLVFSVVSAFIRGFFVEIFSLAGLLAGVTLAGIYYESLTDWIRPVIGYAPARHAAAFLLIAIGTMVVAGIAGRLLRWALRRIGLGWADRLAGAVFGAVKGCIVVTLIVMVLLAFFPQRPWLRDSHFAPWFRGWAQSGASWLPGDLGRQVRHGTGSLPAGSTQDLGPRS